MKRITIIVSIISLTIVAVLYFTPLNVSDFNQSEKTFLRSQDSTSTSRLTTLPVTQSLPELLTDFKMQPSAVDDIEILKSLSIPAPSTHIIQKANDRQQQMLVLIEKLSSLPQSTASTTTLSQQEALQKRLSQVRQQQTALQEKFKHLQNLRN